jgi:hypothetical protein
MRVIPSTPPGKILALLFILAALWVSFILSVARSGRAICVGEMRIASQEALIRQGVWTHLLSEAVTNRLLARTGGSTEVRSGSEIDQARVSTFLASHPNCCRVYPYGPQGGFQYLFRRLTAPSLVSVHVNAPRSDVLRSTTYRVDACSANVRKMS